MGRIMRREKSAYRQKPRKEPTLLRTCKPNTPSAYIMPMMNESTQAEEEYKRKNRARAKSMGGGLVGEFLVCFPRGKANYHLGDMAMGLFGESVVEQAR